MSRKKIIIVRVLLLVLFASMYLFSFSKGKKVSKQVNNFSPHKQVIYNVIQQKDVFLAQIDSIYMAHCVLFKEDESKHVVLSFITENNTDGDGAIIEMMTSRANYSNNCICEMNGHTYYFEWNDKNDCFLRKHFKKTRKTLKKVSELLSIVDDGIIYWRLLCAGDKITIQSHTYSAMYDISCFCLPYEYDHSGTQRGGAVTPLLGR